MADELCNIIRELINESGCMQTNVLCWLCGTEFSTNPAPYCKACTTYKCPNGHCFCGLSHESQNAVERAMYSYGLWEKGNPCGRKK